MLTHSLVSWVTLIRSGIPEFRVARKPIHSLGQTLQPGEPIPDELKQNRTRLRQLYEQRVIEPVHAPRGSKQAGRVHVRSGSIPVTEAVAPVLVSADVLLDAPAPVTEENDTPVPIPEEKFGGKYRPARPLRRGGTH